MRIKLSVEDKDKVFRFIYAILFAGVVFSFYRYGQWINPLWILVFVLVAQQVYVLPQIYTNYFKLYNLEVSKVRAYIPFLNEIEMVPKLYSKALGILWLLILFTGFFAAAPSIGLSAILSVWSIFGDEFAFNASYYFSLITIILYVILCLVRGAAFVSMNRHVNIKYFRHFPYSSFWSNVVEGFKYLFLFSPVFRVLSLSFMHSRLYKIIELNDLQQGKNLEFSVVSENPTTTSRVSGRGN